MAGTRSSARQAAKASSSKSSSPSKSTPGATNKRKATGSNPEPKRGKRGKQKEQTTIEASMPSEAGDRDVNDADMDEPETAKAEETSIGGDVGFFLERMENGKGSDREGTTENERFDNDASKAEANGQSEEIKKKPKENGLDKLMSNSQNDFKESKAITEEGTGSKVSASDNAVEDSTNRAEATPSSILEKGIIYFFFRGRVGINEPSNVNDVARSYIVLRPLPHGAQLGAGPVGDSGNNRMLSLPKKVLPVSPKDRFMIFVEKSKSSLDDIKHQLSSSDYSTKTAGVRHTPAAAPIGEGVYAITQTGRETHLAYILSIPSELGDVQKDVGLKERGSYITSAKNPKSPSSAIASLPQGAEYPQEIIDEFHGRGWMPLQPKLLDYDNTQFLLIGHGNDALNKATKPQDGEDREAEKETPLEEMEKLEGEDESRIEGLKEDDAVFIDLGLSSREYPKVQTTFGC